MADLTQLMARHVIFPIESWRIRSTTPSHLKELEKSQFLSTAEIRDLQLRRLRTLLLHAFENCPFYRERFNRADFDPKKVQTLQDIRSLPILTKQDIQKNKMQMKAINYTDKMLSENKTGGSTGQPLYFYLDKDRVCSRRAATFRHNRWTGWDIGTRTATLWGHRGDMTGFESMKARARNFLLDRTIFLDTSSITKARLEDFKSKLKRFNPEVYIAYANSIYLFARYLKETGATDYHHPGAIITTAEVLGPEQRDLIENVFECRVFDRYGSRETSVIASECEKHNGLHICAETFIVEFIKDNQAVKSGQLGKIVITDLLNYGMPFIRYQIEDAGIPSEETCSCGRGLPLMKMTAGRVTDFLVTPDGRIISGAALTIYLIANAPGVAQAQLVQEKINEIKFKIVKDEKYGEGTLQFFKNEIPKFFGSDIKYDIELVDNIPLESSGKYRFSISRIDPAEMF
jgi:phenylacetate-CoA ligase